MKRLLILPLLFAAVAARADKASDALAQMVPDAKTFHIPTASETRQGADEIVSSESAVFADFNGDGKPDVAICATRKKAEKQVDGYLFIGTQEKGKWSLVQQEERPYHDFPVLKWVKNKKRLYFWGTITGKPPERVEWDKDKKVYRLTTVDPKELHK